MKWWIKSKQNVYRNKELYHEWTITLRRLKDPIKTRVTKRALGIKSGLSQKECWIILFELNETLAKYKKFSDTEILRQMQIEFPKKRFKDMEVRLKRIEYNNGELTGGIIPKQRSNRYNEYGDKIF